MQRTKPRRGTAVTVLALAASATLAVVALAGPAHAATADRSAPSGTSAAPAHVTTYTMGWQ